MSNTATVIDRPALDRGSSKFRNRSGTNVSAVTPLKSEDNNGNNVLKNLKADLELPKKEVSSQPMRSYKVLIEYCQGEGKRPSVRLSNSGISKDANNAKLDRGNFFVVPQKKSNILYKSYKKVLIVYICYFSINSDQNKNLLF